MISAVLIKQLREETGVSIGECKKALEEADGDLARAKAVLASLGAATADKKSSRDLGAGVVATYVHSNKTIGVIVELACETDFVARNPEFATLANDICLHIAAMNPPDTTALLAESFVKDPQKTIGELVQAGVQKFGENISITRFTRYALLA
jgi:elongation factor Ts